MIDVNIVGGDMEQSEIDTYIKYIKNKFPNKEIKSIEITIDGDFVELSYCSVPFQRVYRVTDYLVNSLDKLNNAKLAEYNDKIPNNL